MRRTAIKRKPGKKYVNPGPHTSTDFWAAARDQESCAVTRGAAAFGPWDAHHCVEKAEIKKRHGDIYDPRNAIRLTDRAHERHTHAVRRVRLQELRDENIAFAFELMGRAAYVYLLRMYAGSDPRVELAIAELECGL